MIKVSFHYTLLKEEGAHMHEFLKRFIYFLFQLHKLI
jgi:hypothetical protein